MNIIEQFLQSRQEIIQKLLSGINHAVSIGKMFIKINEHHEKNYFIFIIKKNRSQAQKRAGKSREADSARIVMPLRSLPSLYRRLVQTRKVDAITLIGLFLENSL